MRKQELDNWIKSGGDLPQDLTEDEKSYLKGLGWSVEEEWWDNGQKRFEKYYLNGKAHGKGEGWRRNSGRKGYEYYYFHGKEHGPCKVWKANEALFIHKEYAYGILLKDFLKQTS